ncbi:MAG: hypothetical protein JST50_13990 [Bacteroidetes bacterium]|nr:hypothetical protein [Bacteroidota bacterium]
MKKIRRAEANERNKAVKDNLSDIGSFFYEGPVKYNATCNAGVVIESKLPQMVDDRYLGRFCVRIFQPPKAS